MLVAILTRLEELRPVYALLARDSLLGDYCHVRFEGLSINLGREGVLDYGETCRAGDRQRRMAAGAICEQVEAFGTGRWLQARQNKVKSQAASGKHSRLRGVQTTEDTLRDADCWRVCDAQARAAGDGLLNHDGPSSAKGSVQLQVSKLTCPLS